MEVKEEEKQEGRGSSVHPSKPIVHSAYPSISTKFVNFLTIFAQFINIPCFRSIYVF